jgi:Uma2 family endonuclease
VQYPDSQVVSAGIIDNLHACRYRKLLIKFVKNTKMRFADLDMEKVHTYADYYKWKFEEPVELLHGRVFKVGPAPGSMHQRVSSKLHIAIGNYLANHKCEVFSAPFDVRIQRKTKDDTDITTVLQPDIYVICDPAKIDERGCIGPPDVAIEILSAGNSSKEMKVKYDVYEEAGVKEYWVVDPLRETVQVNVLEEGSYTPLKTLVTGTMLTSKTLPGFSLSLSKLFPETGHQ